MEHSPPADCGLSGGARRVQSPCGCFRRFGNEGLEDGINLRFPSGTALDWGNRDYDMNLLVADKAWDNNGQLKFNIFNSDGYLGDRVTVNWIYKPYVDVRARRYRFRILNGSVSRYFKIAIVGEDGKVVPSYMIANDGNLASLSPKQRQHYDLTIKPLIGD